MAEECERLAFVFFALDILRVWYFFYFFLTGRLSHFVETPKSSNRATRANLSRHIPSDRSRRLACSLAPAIYTVQLRHSTVRLCEQAGDTPGDFSRGVYPPPFVCSTYFSTPAGIPRSVSLFLVSVPWPCLPVIISLGKHMSWWSNIIECDYNEFLSSLGSSGN